MAVEGINNYNGVLIPSKIYDDVSFEHGRPATTIIHDVNAIQGVLPPLPKRTVQSVTGE